ncbi:AAA family ATPase [Cereibacter sphaeroides]|jgi:energy-coupling factor transporter ATP-binding protein EcfA2|uniref:AAA family ATPase n=1 Tax=Cereibacter sphaeroides TaxID=1063 RepID=UPI0000F2A2D9|nr:putative ATP-binding protein [Cereibacter sphaeroides ATCC 17029]
MSVLTGILAENFAAFKKIDLKFKPGINIYIGGNGTGKTHLLKTLYAACSIADAEDIDRGFGDKLVGVFHPYEGRPGRISYRGSGSVTSKVTIQRGRQKLIARFSNHTLSPDKIEVEGQAAWKKNGGACAYIPVKEMLAHAPGFLATMKRREIAFEEVYVDIITRAFLPPLKGPASAKRRKILGALQHAIEGKVKTKGEVFFLKNGQGDLEFTLLSEGMRKLALIWILTQNGVLTDGSTLFWDEPEANLNPSRLGEVVEVMLELQRLGVQIFVTTHNYVLLKEFEMRCGSSDSLSYTALFRNAAGEINSETKDSHLELSHNSIADTYDSIYNREVEKSIRGLDFG